MQIHHLLTSVESHYVVDPKRGQIKKTEVQTAASDVEKIVVGGVEYARDKFGNFHVPEEVGKMLTSRSMGGGKWFEGPNPYSTAPVVEDKDTESPVESPAENPVEITKPRGRTPKK